MTATDNADSKWSEKKMEVEDSVRTVDCLRGRLLAERVASRNAKEEADHLGNKLMELENMLKQEAKSRNRAEKRLKSLMKKVKSMNISYVSDESEHSGLVDKSDISSVSSLSSSTLCTSTTKELQDNTENQQTTVTEKQESGGKTESQKIPDILEQNDATSGSSSSGFEVVVQEPESPERETGPNEDLRSRAVPENAEQNVAEENTAVEESSFSAGDANSENSSHLESNQSSTDSKVDEQSDVSYQSVKSSNEEGSSQEADQDLDMKIDNSMALVVVDTPQKNQTIDPEVLDATVKEVLDALRHAKEQLQSSMERRRANMIRVG